jgi:hypothetical protein
MYALNPVGIAAATADVIDPYPGLRSKNFCSNYYAQINFFTLV